MVEYLSNEVRAGLELARKKNMHKKARLNVKADGVKYPILKSWDGGFSLEREISENLRGLVDIYDGTKHLFQALIVDSQEEGPLRSFEFKFTNVANDKAPLDYDRPDDAPIGYIPHY